MIRRLFALCLSAMMMSGYIFAQAPANAPKVDKKEAAPPKARVIALPGKKPSANVAAEALPTAEPPKKPRASTDSMKGYMTKVKAALGKRWKEAVQPRMSDFTPGNVSSNFTLDADGKVTAFTIASNTSNEAFAKFCAEFVSETVFDAPPPKLLVDGQLEIPFTFWIY